MDIEKWADRVYLEEDFGKNIATTLSGLVGLVAYLATDDFPLSAFVTIILFPLSRIIASALRDRHLRRSRIENEKATVEALDKTFSNLTDQERRVIHAFVEYKSAVISDKYLKINSVILPDGAVKTLIERGYITEENFGLNMYDLKLDLAIFEAGRRYFEK